MRRRVLGTIALCVATATAPVPAMDIETFLPRYARRIESIETYQVRISQWSVADDELDAKIMNFYYADPDRIRIDVIEGTRGGGASGLLTDEGRIGIRAGSRLIPIRLTFDLDHPLVTTNRGRTFLDGSFRGILRQLERYAESCTVTADPETTSIVVTIEPCGTADRQVVTFDAAALIPTSSDTYADGVHVEHVEWSSFSEGDMLPDRVFDLSMSQRELDRNRVVRLAFRTVTRSERAAARLDE